LGWPFGSVTKLRPLRRFCPMGTLIVMRPALSVMRSALPVFRRV
jgi:hypothetical protein